MIPTSDFHESEYVGKHLKCREFMTGFTGSAGTAVITKDDAALWKMCIRDRAGAMLQMER